ncbi:hypothetical protein Gpo141_00009061 [Globisporangium polare]
MMTMKRTTERTPLLKQPTQVALDQYDRPIVDAMMPQPVDAVQCARVTVVVTSFSAEDLRERDRMDHVICTNCTAPSKPPQEQEASREEGHSQKKAAGAERSTSWRCWNCNMLHPDNQQQLTSSRFCSLQ